MPEKGGVMGKKLGPIILIALITIYFLVMSAYELWMAYIAVRIGGIVTTAQIVGWISLLLFLLSAFCLLLTIREESSFLDRKKGEIESPLL